MKGEVSKGFFLALGFLLAMGVVHVGYSIVRKA